MLSKSIAILLSSIIFGGVALLYTVEHKQPTSEEGVQIDKTAYADLRPETKKQIDCLANNIYFEARAEPQKGQVAVAQVTLNRTQAANFPSTVCEVVKQKLNSVCQFSWWCNTKARAQAIQKSFKEWDTYEEIRELATLIYLNHHHMVDVTDGALFYHATYVSQKRLGVSNLQPTVHIGQHVFYRTKI